MCGIAGWISKNGSQIDLAQLEKINDKMKKRGPDGHGMWANNDQTTAFAHRRLSIIDLSEGGAQPMSIESRGLTVTFNGEIYNYPELKQYCENKGSMFKSSCDTEVLLHLYRLEGADFVKKLRGMYAFAIWDEEGKTAFLARDPFGIKPLYYADTESGLIFASQVKALLEADCLAKSPISAAGLTSFLMWGYVIEPHTLYATINALPAGHSITLQSGKPPRLECFCDVTDYLRCKAPVISPGDLRAAIEETTQAHLLADVPVGIFLSAGIDSTTLAATLRYDQPKSELRGITMGFEDYRGTPSDETILAAICAEKFKIDHQIRWIGKKEFHEHSADLLDAMDQPTVNGVNTYFVSQCAQEAGLKVAISGVGGDELFGGYPSYREIPKLVNYGKFVPATVGKASRSILSRILPRGKSPKTAGIIEYAKSVEQAYILRRALHMPWEIEGILGKKLAEEGLENLQIEKILQKFTEGIEDDHRKIIALETAIYMRNCLLRDADWAGMAHSLEIRTPLVDIDLFRVLGGAKIGNLPVSKQDFALCPALGLPEEVLNRPKSGFTVPVRDWLLEEGGAEAYRKRGLRGWSLYIAEHLGTL